MGRRSPCARRSRSRRRADRRDRRAGRSRQDARMSAPRMTGSLLPQEVVALARKVVEQNAAIGRRVAVAESCTGGLVSAAITEIPGSSAVFDRGFVTYSDEAKQESLGVAGDIIDAFGAVSVASVYAMARGARARRHAAL